MEANRAPGLRQGSRHGPSMTEQQLRDVLAEQAGRVMKLFKEWELKHEGAGGGSHREVSKAAFRAALRECGLATGAETDILFDKARRPASPARQPASPVQRVASPARQPASPVQRVASPSRQPASPGRAKTRSVASPSLIAANGGSGGGGGGGGGGGESRASTASRRAAPRMPASLPAPPPPPPSFACCYLNGRCGSVAPLLLRIGPPRDLASLLAQVRHRRMERARWSNRQGSGAGGSWMWVCTGQ